MKSRSAKFFIGQLIQHNLFDYRGVIVDVDPVFQRSDEWYDRVAKSRPPKNEPWYSVLAHGRQSQTYVAERNLSVDMKSRPIRNPLISRFFIAFEDGIYRPKRVTH